MQKNYLEKILQSKGRLGILILIDTTLYQRMGIMEAALFTKMLSDQYLTNLKKLGYKYPQADMKEFVTLLKTGFYKTLPLKDFMGNELIYLESTTQVHLSAVKALLTP